MRGRLNERRLHFTFDRHFSLYWIFLVFGTEGEERTLLFPPIFFLFLRKQSWKIKVKKKAEFK